eukprot:TRINITY_DN16586_c0_g1_i1.p1 TRINITY_DN16586_c0_g1~~TRINITY_DN16586_c0_g1_i1.p1  ORF type:complete len:668 (+),score=140.17 TRINITY_DN16586_c0_g1_i1:83-2005(+)
MAGVRRVAFAAGTVEVHARGASSRTLLTRERLRAMPAAQREELLRRLAARKRRQRLAEVTVAQWKYFARHALRKVREERARRHYTLAAAHHRSVLLSKCFDSLQAHAFARRARRDHRIATVLYLRRFINTWRHRYAAAREAAAGAASRALAARFRHWRGVLRARAARRISQRAALHTWRRRFCAVQSQRALHLHSVLDAHFAAWRRAVCERGAALEALFHNWRLFRTAAAWHTWTRGHAFARMRARWRMSTGFHALRAFWDARRRHRLARAFKAWTLAVRCARAAAVCAARRAQAALRVWRAALLCERASGWRRRRAFAALLRHRRIRRWVRAGAARGAAGTLRCGFQAWQLWHRCGRLAAVTRQRVLARCWRPWRLWAQERAGEAAARVAVQAALMRTPVLYTPKKAHRSQPRPLPAAQPFHAAVAAGKPFAVRARETRPKPAESEAPPPARRPPRKPAERAPSPCVARPQNEYGGPVVTTCEHITNGPGYPALRPVGAAARASASPSVSPPPAAAPVRMASCERLSSLVFAPQLRPSVPRGEASPRPPPAAQPPQPPAAETPPQPARPAAPAFAVDALPDARVTEAFDVVSRLASSHAAAAFAKLGSHAAAPPPQEDLVARLGALREGLRQAGASLAA